jgi:hypothetical protein
MECGVPAPLFRSLRCKPFDAPSRVGPRHLPHPRCLMRECRRGSLPHRRARRTCRRRRLGRLCRPLPRLKNFRPRNHSYKFTAQARHHFRRRPESHNDPETPRSPRPPQSACHVLCHRPIRSPASRAPGRDDRARPRHRQSHRLAFQPFLELSRANPRRTPSLPGRHRHRAQRVAEILPPTLRLAQPMASHRGARSSTSSGDVDPTSR